MTGATWIHADGTWTPDRLAGVLDAASARRAGAGRSAARPRLVVVDDAHVLPAATVRLVDQRLERRAREPAGAAGQPVGPAADPAASPSCSGNFTVLRGELLRMDDAECAALVAEHARTTDPEVVRTVTSRRAGLVRGRRAGRPRGRRRPRPDGGRTRLDAEQTRPSPTGVASEVFAALQPAAAPPAAVRRRRGDRLRRSRGAPLPRPAGRRDPRRARDHRAPGEPGAVPPSPTASEDVEWRRGTAIHPLLTEVVRRRLVAGGSTSPGHGPPSVRAVRLDVARGVADGAFGRLVGVNAQDEAADLLAREGVTADARARQRARVTEFVRSPSGDGRRRGPDTWFAIALDRWLANDASGARHWLDRVIEHEPGGTQPGLARTRCWRASGCWRARLGLEPMRRRGRSRQARDRREPLRDPPTTARRCCPCSSRARRRAELAGRPRRGRGQLLRRRRARPSQGLPASRRRRCPTWPSRSSWQGASAPASRSPPRPSA